MTAFSLGVSTLETDTLEGSPPNVVISAPVGAASSANPTPAVLAADAAVVGASSGANPSPALLLMDGPAAGAGSASGSGPGVIATSLPPTGAGGDSNPTPSLADVAVLALAAGSAANPGPGVVELIGAATATGSAAGNAPSLGDVPILVPLGTATDANPSPALAQPTSQSGGGRVGYLDPVNARVVPPRLPRPVILQAPLGHARSSGRTPEVHALAPADRVLIADVAESTAAAPVPVLRVHWSQVIEEEDELLLVGAL